MKKLILILITTVTFFSCTKKKIPSSDTLLGLNYYPTTSGKYVIYEVDSTVYVDLPLSSVNTKYRIKEKIADSFIDNEGKSAIRLERYIKKLPTPPKTYDSIPWTIKEVWMLNADSKSIQLSESNVRFTKLIFPIQEKASWNGNAKNTIGEWLYSYDYIDKAEIINGNALEKVLMVKQFESRTLISYKYYIEKYAKNIGLVYREINDIYSNTVIANVPVEGRIEKGIIYKQTLITYGYE